MSSVISYNTSAFINLDESVNKPNFDKLYQEILDDLNIVTNLKSPDFFDYGLSANNVLDIKFVSDLTNSEKNALDQIVREHDGLPRIKDESNEIVFESSDSSLEATSVNEAILELENKINQNSSSSNIIAQGYSSDISITTNTSFQNKLYIVLPELQPGNYELQIGYGWNIDSTSRSFESRVTFNSSQLGEIHLQEPKEAGGNGGANTGTNQRYYVFRKQFLNIQNIVNEGGIITLDWRTQKNNVEASIWEASLTLIKLSNTIQNNSL